MLSQTAEHALRAVLHLADRADQGPVPVDRIADALGIPRNYLSKTLHQLAREGILASTRGPHGGFELAVSAERLTLYRIVEPFDDLEERRTCLLGRPRCSDRDPCPAHARWKDVSDRVATFFRETTVAGLIREEEEEEEKKKKGEGREGAPGSEDANAGTT